MRKFQSILLIFILLSTSFATNITISIPVKEVTIYSNGVGFIKRFGHKELPNGELELSLPNFTQVANIDSVSVYDMLGEIMEIGRYEKTEIKSENITRQLSFYEILNESLNKEVSVKVEKETKTGILIWYDELRIGIRKGGEVKIIKISDIEEFGIPNISFNKTEEVNKTVWEKGLKIRERAFAGLHPITITYLVSGIKWSANYKYYLSEEKNEGEGRLQAWAEVASNVGEDWENVTLKVVVGYPHIISIFTQVYDYVRRVGKYKEAKVEYAYAPSAPGVAEEFIADVVSAYYVYTLKYPVSLKSGETRSFSLFDKWVKYKREFVWDTNWEKPRKIFKLNNTGDESWADGIVRIYLKNDFIGEDKVKYTAKGREVEVYTADIPDIYVKKEVIESITDKEGCTQLITYKIRLTLENHKNEDVEITIKDWMQSGDKVALISASITPSIKPPGTLLEWKIKLNKEEKKQIDYTYRITNYRLYC